MHYLYINYLGFIIRINYECEKEKLLKIFPSDILNSHTKKSGKIVINTELAKDNYFCSKNLLFKIFLKEKKLLFYTGNYNFAEYDTIERKGHIYLTNTHFFEKVLKSFVFFVLQYIMINSGGFLIHSCGAKINDKGVIFIAKSGGGKTTIAKLINSQIISDEVSVILSEEDRFFIENYNEKIPLHHIFFLRKSDKLKCESLPKTAAVKLLMENIRIFKEPLLITMLLENIENFIEFVPASVLYFPICDKVGKFIKSKIVAS